jgi:hypothetical protein
MLLEMSLERRDIFNNAIGSTQKAGKLIKTLLNYVNFYSSVGSDRILLTRKLPTLKDLIELIFTAVLDNRGHCNQNEVRTVGDCMKLGIVFPDLFVYTVLYFLRFYVCKRLYAV